LGDHLVHWLSVTVVVPAGVLFEVTADVILPLVSPMN